MRILVTGAHGKVGRALVPRLVAAGYDVRASDLTRPAYALVTGCDVVVHTAAIPQPIHNAPHVVFGNNIMSTFNVLEAAITGGSTRFVHFSSETVPGFIYALRPFSPANLTAVITSDAIAATGASGARGVDDRRFACETAARSDEADMTGSWLRPQSPT